MSKPTKEEIEESINEHLEKIRKFTFGALGDNPPANHIMTYMMANVAHVAELMWAAQVEMTKGLNMTTKLFKSVYTKFNEAEKEESNEEAK